MGDFSWGRLLGVIDVHLGVICISLFVIGSGEVLFDSKVRINILWGCFDLGGEWGTGSGIMLDRVNLKADTKEGTQVVG